MTRHFPEWAYPDFDDKETIHPITPPYHVQQGMGLGGSYWVVCDGFSDMLDVESAGLGWLVCAWLTGGMTPTQIDAILDNRKDPTP